MRQFFSWFSVITLLGTLAGAALAPGLSAAADGKPAQPAKPEIVQLLFVQNAQAVAIDKAKRTLTLKRVSPSTLFFSDRPQRIAGHYHTRDEFLPLWTEGKDSFLKDPPNADISIVEGKELRQVVAVLQHPELKGDSLSYTVKVLQGEMPAKGADVSIFIDVIGMPLTPVS